MVDMPYILNTYDLVWSTKPNHIYLIYMYKEDLSLNNIQWLICQNQIIYISYMTI